MSDNAPGSDEHQGTLAEAVEEERDKGFAAKSEASEAVDDEVVIDDPMFEVRDGLFRNKEMVRVGWVPNGKRIVGRDEYIDEVSSALNDAVVGKQPDHLAITGKTGTGKSLVSRFVAERAKNAGVEGVDVGVVYIDCSEASTVTQLISSIGQQLNDISLYEDEDNYVNMPDAGLSKKKFYERLWYIMDRYDSAIVILDEVDMLDDDVILMNLAKAVEKRSTDCRVGIVAISNIIGFFNGLGARTQSVFQPDELNFDPYDANDLVKILKGRKDAFRESVLEEGVIELVAALSAQEHGDARKAMRLFRMSGEVAEKKNDEKVCDEHVRQAQHKVEEDRFVDFLTGTPTQMKVACLALASHMLYGKDDYVQTGDIYSTAKQINHIEGINEVSIRRFRDILNEMALHGVTESKRNNLGKKGGKHNMHRLLHSPDVVRDVTMRDELFRETKVADLRDLVQSTYK